MFDDAGVRWAKTYTGPDLRTALRGFAVKRGVGDAHFDAVAVHLKATLEELGVGPTEIGEVLTIVGGTRADVLGRQRGGSWRA